MWPEEERDVERLLSITSIPVVPDISVQADASVCLAMIFFFSFCYPIAAKFFLNIPPFKF